MVSEQSRTCKVCLRELPLDQFGRRENGSHIRRRECKECQYARIEKWRRANMLRVRANAKHRRSVIRLEMIMAYGGKCVCCGESEPQFLSIDHINGGGKQERDALFGVFGLVAHLKRQGWPKGSHQLLCHNCNSAKGFYGECPHARKRLAVI